MPNKNYWQLNKGDFPSKISAPVLRALLNAKIYNLTQLATHKEAEVFKLHGIGSKAIKLLSSILKTRKLSFKK